MKELAERLLRASVKLQAAALDYDADHSQTQHTARQALSVIRDATNEIEEVKARIAREIENRRFPANKGNQP